LLFWIVKAVLRDIPRKLFVRQVRPRNPELTQRIDKVPPRQCRQLGGLAKGNTPQLEQLGGRKQAKLFTCMSRIHAGACEQGFIHWNLNHGHISSVLIFRDLASVRAKRCRVASSSKKLETLKSRNAEISAALNRIGEQEVTEGTESDPSVNSVSFCKIRSELLRRFAAN